MNKKKTGRSTTSLPKSKEKLLPEVELPPLDKMILKILSLRVTDLNIKNFAIIVSFFDQLLVNAIIMSIGAKEEEPTSAIAMGSMQYDPSDYEKMCLFANCPLVVKIQPLYKEQEGTSNLMTLSEPAENISCCNVDILPFFLDNNMKGQMFIRKRMEPMKPPPPLKCKSWDTLPLLTMELTAEPDALNVVHHKVLQNANWMKLTLIASYNMYIPFENEYVYTAASKIPHYNKGDGDGETNAALVTFSQGYSEPRRFDGTNFYPKWESLRSFGEVFTQGDHKLQCKLKEIINENNIYLQHYFKPMSGRTTVWGSFHRTLIINGDEWLWKHLRSYKWPVEIHIYGEKEGYSFMAFLNLLQLLYPGERAICLAVPLQWINAESMMSECGCELLLTPNDRPPSLVNERNQGSYRNSLSTMETAQWNPTGGDDNDAFILVEVQLRRSLKPIIVPPRILTEDICAMLTQMELNAPKHRICTGRGQLEHEWSKTVRSASNLLRKVPYYGHTELCTFSRQLSETRTRVQLTTSCWQEAAIFVNNHFVVKQHQNSDEDFEEMVMMAHACLMKSASNMLIPTNQSMNEVDPMLRAARYARQMQDTRHAMEIYLQLVAENPQNANYWRELSTCLKDIDRDWALVCLNQAVVINPRHPLTLISKGAMLFEENPSAAEQFFITLLYFHPTWTTAWTIASAFFYERELFQMSDIIIKIARKWSNLRCPENVNFQRKWEHELGDWWDNTPLIPGMNLYYDAADLLLRLRAVALAEVCMARVLSESGETAQYYHMVGLCCRLRGNHQEALCHLSIGIDKFAGANYLRSLEAEVHHCLGNFDDAMVSFEKAGNRLEPFSTLMSLSRGDKQRVRAVLLDLVRRRPSAHAWTALAEDWLNDMPPTTIMCGNKGEPEYEAALQAKRNAIACAIQALKIDRHAGRTWAILSKLVKPNAKRLFCIHMANTCGWKMSDEDIHTAMAHSRYSNMCDGVGNRLRECSCKMCYKTRM